MDERQQGETAAGTGRWRTLRALLWLLLALVAAALLILWLMRVRLATDYIDRELERRGVQASYDVRRIGLGTQRFENLVIGDPARPDLTAREVHIRIHLSLRGPRVGLITARGVRLRGRVLEDGRVSFGEVDKLLPPPTGLPFRLPDQAVALSDAAVTLETPAGLVAIGLAGAGNLADGFQGNLAFASRSLELGGCRIDAPSGNFRVRVDDLRPTFRGPARIAALRCGGDVEAEAIAASLDARLAPAFDAWRGEAHAGARRFRAGPVILAGATGDLGFDGGAGMTRGRLDIGAAGVRLGQFAAGRTGVAGEYSLSLQRGDFALDADATATGIVGGERALGPIASALDSLGGTPLEPIGEALADAVLRAGRSADAGARLRIVNRPEGGAVRVQRLSLASRSGMRVAISGGDGLGYAWPRRGWRIDGDALLSGGGFPDARFRLSQAGPGAPLRGVGRIAPYEANGARLELAELRFSAAADGATRIDSFATMDGPIPDGRVERLAMPVALRLTRGGGLLLGEQCTPVAWRSLQVDGLRIGPSRIRACPVGPALIWRPAGGRVRAVADIAAPRFAGTVGGAPLVYASDRLRFDFTDFAFQASGADVAIGPADGATRIAIGSFAGSFEGNDLAGPFAGMAARIPNVPLVADQAEGRWRLARGTLSLDGRVRVSDEQDPPRFHPLVSDDFTFSLTGERIRAGGWLRHPASGIRVTEVAVDHNLTTGAGRAALDVPGIAFTESFQPDDLTPLTVGVVALVRGNLTGRGEIAWSEAGVASTGTFSTAGMNLAAPFGPVEGLTTSIRFTDLLGLVSAPGQVARIDRIRTGIDVYDGTLRYKLEPNYHVRIEEGLWPFAGGELRLEPTLLDFSQESAKHLTFRVTGLDAARFVQQMEFGNIAATGTFDGVIPMVFDARGGRIVGGRLAAREGGGTLSYVGELTDRELGFYGKLAFDALKELRYSRFVIDMDGDLAGEFLANIQMDGLTTAEIDHWLLRRFRHIPFRFNIRAQGPFRALIATMRSFDDPWPLIQQAIPGGAFDRLESVTDNVQDEESEAVR